MRYQLKNKKLQRQLDALSDGEFSKQLSKEHIVTMVDDSGIPVLKVEFGPVVGLSLTRKFIFVFTENEIKEAEEFHRDRWNKFPEITPPENEWMRCEFGEVKRIAKWVPDGDSQDYVWIDNLGQEVNVKRFRPWED